MNKIKIRAHHLLCIEGFKGLGYSKDFVENMKKIILQLSNVNSVFITAQIDDICAKCPYSFKNKCNNSYGRPPEYMDENLIKKLGISKDTQIDYQEVRKKIYEVFKRKEDLFGICDKCGWKDVCGFYQRF